MPIPPATELQEQFFRMVDYQRRKLKLSWRDVSRITGVPPSTTTRLAHGKVVESTAILHLWNWVRVETEERTANA